MKKFAIIPILFCLAFMCFPCIGKAETSTQYYAKVQKSSAFLCSTPSENSALFELPYSFFVKVEESVDDYFRVTYKDISGFVKKDKVALMNGTPQQPYAQVTFKVFAPYALYETPNQSSKTDCQVDTATPISFYGTKSGQQVSDNSNLWYFSCVTIDGTPHFGYVFSGICFSNPNPGINSESFEIVSESVLSKPGSSEFKELSTGTKAILIVAISIPSLLILYFLIKPSKILQTNKSQKQKKQNHIKRHGDYFEFDESEL